MEELVVVTVKGTDGHDENDVAASLSQRELQQTLKSWKVLAMGTTKAFRQCYQEERLKRLGAKAAGAVASTAAAGGTTITAFISLDDVL